MAIFNHELPSTTVSQSRLKIFQATRRPMFIKDQKIVTSWGTLHVSGKLGQGHADVLEALIYCAEQNSAMEDGRFKILVDPYQVKKYANLSSTKELKIIIKDLMMAVISGEFTSHKNSCHCIFTGHLIDHMQEAIKKNGNKVTKKNPLNQEQRSIWRVELGKALSDIIKNDIWHTSNPIFIAQLTSGVSQALARFIRSHRIAPRGGWILDNAIREITSENISSQQLRDRRREIRKDMNGLIGAGVQIVGNRVHKVKNDAGLLKKIESVEQTPEGVEQTPDSVEQTPDVWSKPPVLTGLSDLSGTPLHACIHLSN